ncbi:uncharacterized protein [Arachis hypogaea]|uniref:uncharacterized protein n=1 Tax=Arachis hypogaea TaxID=3818 RepID=UPI003B22863D
MKVGNLSGSSRGGDGGGGDDGNDGEEEFEYKWVPRPSDMADNGVHQLTQAELIAQMAELQAEVKRLAELSAQNNTNKREEGNPKSSAQGGADLLIADPPKEKLTLDNPFSEEITNFQMPKHFTLPSSLEPYKGIGDPRTHIKKFQSMIFFNGSNNEPVLCRAFPTYLDGAALIWFSKLPAGSISSFEELAKSFIDYFAAARIYVHGSDYLGTIRQGPQESLRDYLTRFAEATMEIPDLDPAVQLHSLKVGLRPGKFRETIAITKPKTLEEFRERAAGQMEIEELREANKTERRPKREEDRTPRSVHNKELGKPFKLTPKFDNYTRFNTRREKIIKEILNAKIIKPPARAAKDLLERLARQGVLDKYIEGRKHKEGDRDKEERQQASANKDTNKWSNNTQPKGVINCISGGFAGGGETTSARKRRYRAMLVIEGTAPPSSQDTPDLEITFNKADICSAAPHLDDLVVISIQTGNLLVRKVLLDPGSSADVLFYSTFLKMNLSEKLIQSSSGELVGFSGERVPIKGYIWLKMTMGDDPLSRTLDIQYLIVDCISPYNIILGRPALNMFRAVISTFHLCVKFQAQDGKIATIHSDRQQARQCYNSSLKKSDTILKQHEVKAVQTMEVLSLAELDPRGDTQERPQPSDELQKIQLTSKPEQVTYIGQALQERERSDLIKLLQANADLFAWTPADMPGISPDVICHKLATNMASRPIAQKKRNLGAEKSKAALEETSKLLQANFIREIRFTTWLSNVVMILTKPELAGRLTKWSIELSEFDIQFQLRSALKAQILADFISELTPGEHNKSWELHVDGASSREGSGAGVVLKEGDQVIAEQSLQFHFPASNNQAEYEALIAGLKLALSFQVQSLTAHCDSLLVVQQIRGEFQVKDPSLEQYWLMAKDLISKFNLFIILHVNRGKNVRADVLSKLAATRADTQTSALIQLIKKKPSIELLHMTNINHLHDWRALFIEYISTVVIRRDELNPQHFRRKASLYTSIAGKLYRRGFSQPLLKYLSKDEAKEVMDEIHEGVCGNHIGGRVLAAKIVRTGYNTTVQTTTGETPFKLVYGSEALIPIEVGIPTLRTELYDEQHNLRTRSAELDITEETRELAAIKQRAIKQLAERKHNKKVSPRTFAEGDLVLRQTEEARRPPTHGKLAANWEGPFRVIKVLGMGAYQLQTLQGNPISGTWNVSSLKMYRS